MRAIRGGDAGYQLRGNERIAIGGNLAGIGNVTQQVSGAGDFNNTNQQFVIDDGQLKIKDTLSLGCPLPSGH